MTSNLDKNSSKNRLLFKLVLVMLPIFLLLIIEGFLRLFSVGHPMKLIINHPLKEYSSFYTINPHVGEKYFTKFEATGTTNDIFLKKKPSNGVRIFIMGSSTIVGFPYGQNLMASRILHQQLQDAYPNKEIEVINTAITAINTITLKDYIKQIIKYSPDAIVFYAGHNEFYGAFGIGSNESLSKNAWVQNLHFSLMNLRLYQSLQKSIINVGKLIATKSGQVEERGSLMKRIVGDKNITYQGDIYKYGINQYRKNISEIIKVANQNNVPLFLSNLVSNIKDLPPLIASTNPEHMANQLYNKGQLALNRRKLDSATYYLKLAKDYDPIRFRAPEEINHIIDSLCKALPINRIDMKRSFNNYSEDGIVGNKLLSEHVHPTIKGQFIFSNTIFTEIVASNIIGKDISPYYNKTVVDYQYYWPYTKLDSLMGDKYVKQLQSYWPFASFENNTTYRDNYKPTGYIDSLAYKILLKSNVSKANLHEQMAKKHYAEKKYNLALKEYECLVKYNPYRSYYYNKVAECYLKENDFWNAELSLLKSIQYTPSYFAHLYLSDLFILQNNINESIKQLKKALELSNNKKEKHIALKKLADCYKTIGETKKKNTIENQLKKEQIKYTANKLAFDNSYYSTIPNNILSFHKKANKFVLDQNFQMAIKELQKSLKINDCPTTYRYIGDIYLQLKNNQLLFFLNKAYPTFKYDPQFLYSYIIALHVNRKKTEAINQLTQLKSIAPQFKGIESLEQMLSN